MASNAAVNKAVCLIFIWDIYRGDFKNNLKTGANCSKKIKYENMVINKRLYFDWELVLESIY